MRVYGSDADLSAGLLTQGRSLEIWKEYLFLTHLAALPVHQMPQTSFGPVVAHTGFTVELSDEFLKC